MGAPHMINTSTHNTLMIKTLSQHTNNSRNTHMIKTLSQHTNNSRSTLIRSTHIHSINTPSHNTWPINTHDLNPFLNTPYQTSHSPQPSPLVHPLSLSVPPSSDVLVTIEEGSKGGFGDHVLHYLAQEGQYVR